MISILLILVILSNLALLGSSRLRALVRIAAAQGIALGLAPLLARANGWEPELVFLAAAAGTLKGVVFPALLLRALREAHIRREVEPFVSFGLSHLAGIAALAGSFWLASRLPLPGPVLSPLALPVAFFTIFTGFFLLTARRKALTQVLGYLVLENGIYLFGVTLGPRIPFAVELGVLLDVFMAVFVMGIAIFHISREFDHLDASRLRELTDFSS